MRGMKVGLQIQTIIESRYDIRYVATGLHTSLQVTAKEACNDVWDETGAAKTQFSDMTV